MIHHGVPEDVVQRMIDACGEFFEMEEEEKLEFQGPNVLDAIRFGTSFNAAVDKVMCWKDYLKVMVHPQFNSPHKPPAFRYVYVPSPWESNYILFLILFRPTRTYVRVLTKRI